MVRRCATRPVCVVKQADNAADHRWFGPCQSSARAAPPQRPPASIPGDPHRRVSPQADQQRGHRPSSGSGQSAPSRSWILRPGQHGTHQTDRETKYQGGHFWTPITPILGSILHAFPQQEVIPFFAFPPAVRKIIYTTNAIDRLNRVIRKTTKTRGSFPTDDAATKLIYLAIRSFEKTCRGVTE